MWWIDFPTLVLIIVAGMQLGLQGFFGWNATEAIFGAHGERLVFMLVGLSAIWQLFRQKFH